jgi:hypothetical protein
MSLSRPHRSVPTPRSASTPAKHGLRKGDDLPGPHPFRQPPFIGRIDHSVRAGNLIPRRLASPGRRRHLVGEGTADRRPLRHRRHERLIGRQILTEALAKFRGINPDEAVTIRRSIGNAGGRRKGRSNWPSAGVKCSLPSRRKSGHGLAHSGPRIRRKGPFLNPAARCVGYLSQRRPGRAKRGVATTSGFGPKRVSVSGGRGAD